MTAEADDIIFVLTSALKDTKHLIVSTDGDFFQILTDNVKQWHPFRQKILDTPTAREKAEWAMQMCVQGQAKDNIKPIIFETEISDDFIKWCKTKHDLDITKDMIDILKEKYSYYMTEYKIEKEKEDLELIRTGAKKQKRNLTAYKKPMFGDVAYKKFMKDFDINMQNKTYQENFKINQILMLHNHIDSDIQEAILESYSNLNKGDIFSMTESMNNFTKISNYLIENNLPGLEGYLNKL